MIITTTIITLAYRLFTKYIARINIEVERDNILTLVLIVIVFDCTKSCKLFLYSFVDTNHLLKRFDPLVKKKDDKIKKGVVGKTGIIIPINPNNRNKKAKVK